MLIFTALTTFIYADLNTDLLQVYKLSDVNDTLGNSNSIYLRIIKDTSNPTPSKSAPPGIPGYELGTLVAILGIVSVIIGIKQKRANKH